MNRGQVSNKWFRKPIPVDHLFWGVETTNKRSELTSYPGVLLAATWLIVILLVVYMLRAFIPLYTVITYVILCNYLSIFGWFPPHCLRSILKPRRIVSPGLPRWFGCLISAWYSEWSCIVFYGVSPFIWSFHSYHQMDIKWIQGYHRYMEFGCLNGVVSPFYWPKPKLCVVSWYPSMSATLLLLSVLSRSFQVTMSKQFFVRRYPDFFHRSYRISVLFCVWSLNS